MRNIVLQYMKYFTLILASWIFLPSTYTHREGVRIDQYARVPAVSALPTPKTQVYSRRYYHEPGYYRLEINAYKP